LSIDDHLITFVRSTSYRIYGNYTVSVQNKL